ncbi:MAG: acetyl-CoA carboxylase biotin carboxylase subunit family protein [Alphaproteobacteria bacterium]
MTDEKHVFFVGLDDYNKQTLATLPQARECEFHAALTFDEMRDDPDVPIRELIELAASRMEAIPGGPAGVTSFFDFPGTIISAILAERFGLPGPGLESLLKCEHKYWSRMEQQKVAAENIPVFQAFSPFDDEAYSKIGILPPYWIKPIKSFRSYLAYAITDERQFAEVMEVCREKSPAIVDPFRAMMRDYAMPDELTGMPETFLAESTISGAQCTLEGYAFDGRVVVYGVVDSVREPDSSSFSRYEYPSTLPLEIQHRMMDVTRAVVQQFGYAHGPFNAEFFYDQTGDNVWLLEVNPRASQSHADLFLKVHGVTHFSVIVDLALGRKPRTFKKEGTWNVAGHFFIRTTEAGKVVRTPTKGAIDRLLTRQPDTRIAIGVERGMDLAALPNQDSYSFQLCTVDVGGRDHLDMLDRYDQVMTALQFEIEPQAAA